MACRDTFYSSECKNNGISFNLEKCAFCVNSRILLGHVACEDHSYDILGAGMLWKPKEARILTNFIDQHVNIW